MVLGGVEVAGGKLKEQGYAHWNLENIGATNETGFTALPGGVCTEDGDFFVNGKTGYFWSSTESNYYYYAWYRSLYHYHEEVEYSDSPKENGFSVRCIKD